MVLFAKDILGMEVAFIQPPLAGRRSVLPLLMMGIPALHLTGAAHVEATAGLNAARAEVEKQVPMEGTANASPRTHMRGRKVTTRLLLGVWLVLLPTGVAEPAEVPLGHKDFYPSPDRPVGFRGDGNGYFPGAT